MTTDRIALARPINTAASADAVTFGDTGGTHCHFSLTAGTYYSVMSLLHAISNAIVGTFATATVSITSYKVRFTFADAQAITWADTTLRDWLGFTGNSNAATTHTATYSPQHVWISTYAPSDQTDFYLPMGESWQGVRALDGNLSGVQQYSMDAGANHCMGFTKDLSLHFEPTANIFIGSGANASEIYRCLEYFITQSRSATVAGIADPAATGFWFLWDADNLNASAHWGDMSNHNGVRCLESSFLWQFCQVDPGGFGLPNPALPAGKARYNVKLRLRQAEYPGGLL
jgi:hypothetical protein